MIDSFRNLYGSADGIRVFRAPGRVNLIGEHTDYNLGFVLPVALQLATHIAVAPSRDGKLRIHSEDRCETREWSAADIGQLQRSGSWADYPIGVAQELIRSGYGVPAANLLIRSTVPEGSGLSSSAALEVSSALAFLSGRAIAPLELALLCQRAEVNFVGMPCGIMDQYVSVFGRQNAAVEIDCRNLGHRYVDLPDGIAFVAVNTMVKHALASSAYRQRVEECAAAASQLGVPSLRDATPAQLGQLNGVILRRARHVVTENARVECFMEASARADLSAMGKLLVESHRSLQHDYEVSSPELDFLVDAAMRIEGVYGSRMTGGGFGGCTVTMMRPGAVERFEQEIARAYEAEFGVKPAIYLCEPSAGAGEVQAAPAS
jgi:galactokinase